MSTGDVLDLDRVSKRYGSLQALSGLSLRVPAGICGLLGPNGAGKSTLIKVLLGLLRFDGSARVLGIDARERPFEVRSRVGYMPERECHLPGLDAVEMCAYGAELCGLPRGEALSRAHAVLEFVGLGDKRYQPVDGYSTGLKQRAKLAQALAHDPELLLLDEPTNGLDPAGRDEMLALVKSLPARTGCSVLLSTHLLPDVEQVCDHAVLLADGEVRFAGALSALRKDEGERWEVRVKATGARKDAGDGEARLSEALSRDGCGVDRDGSLLLVRPGPRTTTDTVFQAAATLGLQVRHLQSRRVSLEQAFLKVVAAEAPAAPRAEGAGAARSPDEGARA